MSDTYSLVDYGEQLVLRYRASGLTRKEFAEQADISVSTLDYYVRRERKAALPAALLPNRILPVDLIAADRQLSGTVATAQSAGIAIRLANGRAVEVGRGFDAELLLDLLAVLEGNKREETR